MKQLVAIITALVCAVLLAGGYAFMLIDINDNVARSAAAEGGAESLSIRDAAARSLELFLSRSAAERAALNAFIVPDEDVVAVIELLEDAARRTGVSIAISTIAAAPRDGWSAHEAVEVSFSATGTFVKLARFSALLEALPLASRLESVSLETSAEGAWFGSFSMFFIKERS